MKLDPRIPAGERNFAPVFSLFEYRKFSLYMVGLQIPSPSRMIFFMENLRRSRFFCSKILCETTQRADCPDVVESKYMLFKARYGINKKMLCFPESM